jgi:ATP-dependent exoDNAse (exonuclease V) alpha subunit
LKIGARVMIIRNIYGGRLDVVNGDMGTLVEIDEDEQSLKVIVDREPDIEVEIYRTNWDIYDSRSKLIATINQIPVVLAWGLTIHKVQGITIGKIIVDFDTIFTQGQAYVALSRCKNAEYLRVINYNPNKIMVDKKALEFYNSL